jgi:hypothetical protein
MRFMSDNSISHTRKLTIAGWLDIVAGVVLLILSLLIGLILWMVVSWEFRDSGNLEPSNIVIAIGIPSLIDGEGNWH